MLQTYSYRRPSLTQSPQWLPIDPPHPSSLPLSDLTKSPQLTLITLNIWFDAKHADIRYHSIFSLLLHRQADIVCLQEVTDTFLGLLRGHPGIREKYGYFGGGGQGEKIGDEAWYGCLILYRLDTIVLSQPEVYDCPRSNQGRHILHTKVYGKKGRPTEGISDFRIGTAHIESPVPNNPNRSERERQLQSAHSLLSSSAGGRTQGALFCGDTNVSPADEMAFPIDMAWWASSDVWLRAGKNGGEATFGVTYPVKEPPKRLDRVFLFEQQGMEYKVEKAEYLGQERIQSGPDGTDVFLSDHLGVMVTVRLYREGQADGVEVSKERKRKSKECTVA